MSQIDTSDQQKDLFGTDIHATVDQVMTHLQGIEPDDMERIYAPRLVEFYEMHRYTLQTMTDLTPQQTHKIAAAMVTAIGDYFGGVAFYLPHNDKMRLFLRDIAITNEFTGNNISSLARKYKCSHTTVYKAISNIRKFQQKSLNL